MDLLVEYEKIKKEVENFNSEILSESKLETQIEKYYKGVQIMFSPITENPKIMFIGINPGAGFFYENDRNVKRFSPLNKNEYSHGEYRLAQQTRKLFELAELTEQNLADSVKSNCFFFATKSEKELYQFLSHLKSEKVYLKSEKWINNLVSIIKPEIIICEGKSAFERFTKDKECKFEIDKSVLYAEWNDIDIIGYKRNFSNIKEIKKVAEKLKIINENRLLL